MSWTEGFLKTQWVFYYDPIFISLKGIRFIYIVVILCAWLPCKSPSPGWSLPGHSLVTWFSAMIALLSECDDIALGKISINLITQYCPYNVPILWSHYFRWVVFSKKGRSVWQNLWKKISLRLTAVERGPLSGSSSKFYFVENIITTWRPPSRPRRHCTRWSGPSWTRTTPLATGPTTCCVACSLTRSTSAYTSRSSQGRRISL